jgi:ribosomal protein S12 methylthiotransferase
MGKLDVWTRLHYVYPYPHVDSVIPLMAEGKILPYLDIPFQHASPQVLKAMRRPANQVKTLDRIKSWRDMCPDLTIRSNFIVGFPGETEEDFEFLLDWIEEAEIDRDRLLRIRAGDRRAGQRARRHRPRRGEAASASSG